MNTCPKFPWSLKLIRLQLNGIEGIAHRNGERSVVDVSDGIMIVSVCGSIE